MKLLMITCLKEYLADASKIFKQAGINVFSTVNIMGHRDGNPSDILKDWFASGDEQFDSIMIFSFTSEANVAQGMELIKKYNDKLKENFPVRAFILPVENSL